MVDLESTTPQQRINEWVSMYLLFGGSTVAMLNILSHHTIAEKVYFSNSLKISLINGI